MDRLLASPDDAYFLGGFPQVHLSVAEDYRLYPELFRSGAVHPYQEHSQGFLEDVAGASRSLPRMFLDVATQKLPDLLHRLEAGGPGLHRRPRGGPPPAPPPPPPPPVTG